MVQKKATDKLGISFDAKNCTKSEKRLTSSKASYNQTPEGRTKGGSELKKIMKKSGSIKRPDSDTLQVSQGAKARSAKSKPKNTVDPGLAAVATPQKPPLVMVTPQKAAPRVKIAETPPNYMKSTSCSAARKERRRVSLSSSKTSSDSKSPSQTGSNSSKLSSASGHRSGRTPTKTSSLRPVRTLTKTSGNKAGRASMKKSSGAALYADQNIRKDTCSSTLKDSKFPPYVALQPGGTESEGFSVMKVCPYTYCSLNGHHHAQLPPLKSFLAAKRQSLKTQKSLRLKSLSPVRRKPSEVPKNDIDTGQMVFKDSGESISPSIGEEGVECFVEIYTPSKEISSAGSEKVVYGDRLGFGDTCYSAKDGDETVVGNEGGRYAESLPDDPAYSAISFEDNINRDTDFVMEDIDVSMFFLEYKQKQEIEGRDYLASNTNGDGCPQNFLTGYESGESQTDDSMSYAGGMDWEEGETVDTYADTAIIAGEEQESLVCLKEFIKEAEQHEEALANEEVQFVHGESEYLEDDQFEDVYRNLEIVLSSIINMEESSEEVFEMSSGEENVKNETKELVAIGTSSDVIEHVQNDNSPEPEPEAEVVPEDPEIERNLCEPEHKDCELESAIVVSAEDLSDDKLLIPDVNVDVVKEAEDDEDQAEVKARNNNSSALNNSMEGFKLKSVEKSSDDAVQMKVEDATKAIKTTAADDGSSDQECPKDCINFSKHTRCKKKQTEVSEDPREFNPRGPNFLPVVPEPNPETVDLRHQDMDERKNAEEWMVDYALRRAVNKLAPARKRKVALLVEAFETVVPLPKYEIRVPRTPTGFAQARYMQACN